MKERAPTLELDAALSTMFSQHFLNSPKSGNWTLVFPWRKNDDLAMWFCDFGALQRPSLFWCSKCAFPTGNDKSIGNHVLKAQDATVAHFEEYNVYPMHILNSSKFGNWTLDFPLRKNDDLAMWFCCLGILQRLPPPFSGVQKKSRRERQINWKSCIEGSYCDSCALWGVQCLSNTDSEFQNLEIDPWIFLYAKTTIWPVEGCPFLPPREGMSSRSP